MWELIKQNQRKSFVLFILMGGCLILLGYLIGSAYAPPDGGIAGVVVALAIWMVLSLISYFGGDSIMLGVSGAKEITRDMHPQLYNVVEEMKIAGSLPTMPKIYIIDSPAPNAFATGRKPETAAIAVTAGLLARVNRDELQGVVAHEMSHILNRDVLYMTFAGVMLGAIAILSQVFLRGMWYSGHSSSRYRSRSSSGRGQGQAIIMIVALVFAILAPIMARLLYFAISRKREYLADASAARLTRYPEGLASALEKISDSKDDLPSANAITAPLYIVNPLKNKGMKLSDLTSTHPPISLRIKILRGMASGAGYNNYQKAFSRVTGQHSTIIPSSGLKDTETVPLRAAGTTEAAPPTAKDQNRQVGDLIRAVNQFRFLTCTCGLKIKVPPDFTQAAFPCPGCGASLAVPAVGAATFAAALHSLTGTPNQKRTSSQR
ncbi:MAG: M48 family metallopeptidase [candidate division Zixibacteria bacterium]|nr:M48 family metallopeptidase [candidate division Zixibacteria bacterium]